MDALLPLFLWLPLIGFFISVTLRRTNENAISRIAIGVTGLQLIGILSFIVFWLANQSPALNVRHIVLFSSEGNLISIDFYFDKITAFFAAVGAVLTFLVVVYSRTYVHRESGFKRFFNTIQLFFFAYNMAVFSGNFETMFVGWELLGVCTFLLIAFYRERYLPVKNSLKVISIYRLGDICLILAMGMNHHTWHKNVIFLELNNLQLVEQHLANYYWDGMFISIMILIAAAVKSAQLPFSSWLPRAMEGPTASSAIFYGSLTVHIGVFLLLRTFPYWESLMAIKIAIIVIGLFTSLIAIYMARVQSALKAQIAYSSIAQIGLMFIEVALGFHTLALIHFAGNAFLRTYQLLVSPSVQSYLIHEMFFNFVPKKGTFSPLTFSKWHNTLYMLSLKEWSMDGMLKKMFWQPFKWIGSKLNFLSYKVIMLGVLKLFSFGLFAYYNESKIAPNIFEFLPYFLSFCGLLFILKSFSERGSALKAWFYVIAGHLYLILAVALQNENFKHKEIFIYLSGSIVSALVGYLCLMKLKKVDNDIDLDRFHGYVYEQPKTSFVFLLSCLGLAGLPFTPTFIGVDLLFSHIDKDEIVLITITALSIVFIELAVLRMYARLFMGQHKKKSHPMAFRSS